MKKKKKIYLQKKKRSLKKIIGNLQKPRLSVFRSNSHIYAQLIDDKSGHTLAACSTLELKIKESASQEAAFEIGKELAKRSLKKEISFIVFDKGRFAYQGRVKNLAEGARKEGLIF
jgi:large subunit ribosomal protein L18